MAKPKVPKAKKPKAKKPKRRNPVAQKQRQKQSVNVRVINNNGGTGGGTGSDGVRTVPITTYPLFREQYDVAPITLNRNSLPDTSSAPPPPAPPAARVVVPPIPIPPTVRAPFTSPTRRAGNTPSGGFNFGNIYSGGNQNFQYMSRGEIGEKQKRDELGSDSDNTRVVSKKPKSRATASEREDDQPILNARQTEERERAVRIRAPLTDAQRTRKNEGEKARRLAKKANQG